MALPENYLAIDEEGYLLLGETRAQDAQVGRQVLSTLQWAENGAIMATVGTQQAFVEAFDEPLIAQMVMPPSNPAGLWTATANYGHEFLFDLQSLTLDEWDRFHGLNETKVPFVMSRKAQAAFFGALDEFDDDSITFGGKTLAVEPWMTSKSDIRKSTYWSQIYQTETPGWEMNRPAPALLEMLPRLKMPKARILVLGCGSGNDAAYFAEQGHVVTGVDFSPEALEQAQKKYGHLSNLKFVQKDVFEIDHSWNESFDLVFEHTCYCAVPPERRNELVALWRRVLVPTGQLMGVFFAVDRKQGPPFGGSEWEIRARLKNGFHFTFWGRWRKSAERRNGKELFILASKK